MDIDDDEKDDKQEGVYNWEKKFERTWEDLIEDGESLRAKEAEKKRKKRNAQKEARNVRRGMTRHVYIIVDLSKAMSDNDMKPSRLSVTLAAVEAFILDYFDQNPLSQLGIIVTRSSIAEKITELSGNPSKHINALKAASQTIEGEVSLQNSLEVARSTLSFIPKYGTREALLIIASLTTCDPGDIFETIDQLKKDNIKCNMLSLSAEVHVCRAIAEKTGGSYTVAMNEQHFKESLLSHSPPPPATQQMETTLIRMGFPQKTQGTSAPSLCVCHQTPKYGGYHCPQCASKFCELPIDCQICGITLISSSHLARSYHHLFPVPTFNETISLANSTRIVFQFCYSCQKVLSATTSNYSCPRCKANFCSECDDYIHDSLNNCPGCEMPIRTVNSNSVPNNNDGIK